MWNQEVVVAPPDVVPCEIYDLAEDAGDEAEVEEINTKDYNVCAVLDDNFNEDCQKSEELEAILDLGSSRHVSSTSTTWALWRDQGLSISSSSTRR